MPKQNKLPNEYNWEKRHLFKRQTVRAEKFENTYFCILHIWIGRVLPEGNLAIKMHILYEQKKNPISNLQKLWHKCAYLYKNNGSVVCNAASKQVENNLPWGSEEPHTRTRCGCKTLQGESHPAVSYYFSKPVMDGTWHPDETKPNGK